MKKAILLPCFLLGGLSLMAQSQHHSIHHRTAKAEKNQKLISNILAKQVMAGGTANKPTTTQQRVVAQAYIDNNGDRQDSSRYKYTGTKTSKYNFNNTDLQYNTSFQSEYLPSTLSALIASNAYLLADSIYNYQQDTLRETWKAFYRTDNKLDSFSTVYSYSFFSANEKTKHTYNTSGNLTQAIGLTDFSTPNVFDTSALSRYGYNPAGTIVMSDTFYDTNNGVWTPNYVDVFHYNAQNLLDTVSSYDLSSSPAYLSSVTALKYSSNSQLTNLLGFSYDETSALIDVETDTFGYAGTNPYYSYYNSVSIDLANGNAVDGISLVKTLNSNNLPDSMRAIYFDENGMYDDESYKYTYNSFNNPTKLVQTDMSDTSYAGQYNFYYETYDDGVTAINDVKNNKDLNIYPNPFDNKINVTWKGAAAYQAKIALVNILGQTVYTSNKNLVAGTNTLDIPNLIKGNYILLIQDEKGNVWKNQMVKN